VVTRMNHRPAMVMVAPAAGAQEPMYHARFVTIPTPIRQIITSFPCTNSRLGTAGRGFESVYLPAQYRQVRQPYQEALRGVHRLHGEA